MWIKRCLELQNQNSRKWRDWYWKPPTSLFDHAECLLFHLKSTESEGTLNVKGSCQSPKTGRASHKRRHAPSVWKLKELINSQKSFHKTVSLIWYTFLCSLLQLRHRPLKRTELFLITGVFFESETIFLTDKTQYADQKNTNIASHKEQFRSHNQKVTKSFKKFYKRNIWLRIN